MYKIFNQYREINVPSESHFLKIITIIKKEILQVFIYMYVYTYV